MPSVPLAASVAVARRPEYWWRRISGSATWLRVAAVATEEPQMVPKAAQASTAAIAMPACR
jgi:hypothetical protein